MRVLNEEVVGALGFTERRKLGASAELIGRVGDDDLAEPVLLPLRQAGVDLACVRLARDRGTAVSLILVPEDGEKAIVLAEGANLGWTAEDADVAVARVRSAGSGSVLVADVDVDEAVVVRAMDVARERGLRVVLDPSPAERVGTEFLRRADAVTPNPSEAKAITGIAVESVDSAVEAGRAFLARGVGAALMKLKGGGGVVVTRDGAPHVTAKRVTMVDKTGAGDAFAGALGTALLERRSTLDAVRMAVLASTFAVMRYGSQASYPDRDALERFART